MHYFILSFLHRCSVFNAQQQQHLPNKEIFNKFQIISHVLKKKKKNKEKKKEKERESIAKLDSIDNISLANRIQLSFLYTELLDRF